MAELVPSTNAASLPGPGQRSRRRENDDLFIYRLTGVSGSDTFTPFPATGSQRSIYDWAYRVTDTNDTLTPAASSTPRGVSAGTTTIEAGVTFTQATSSAAAFFTFVSTSGTGAGNLYLYVWAK